MNNVLTNIKKLELQTFKNLKNSKSLNTLRAYQSDFNDFALFCSKNGFMANVWGAKYHEADEGNNIKRLVVPKNIQMHHVKFEQYRAKQSGLDGGFRVQKKALWVELFSIRKTCSKKEI